MKFQIGDQVIYPNQGVGTIEEVFTTSVAGMKTELYRLRLESNDSFVMIPVDNVETIGVRRLCSSSELDNLFQILENGSTETVKDWKNRYKENVEKMMSGSIVDVAKVLKNLYLLSCQKPLSFREKKMFDRARQLIISEIATVQKRAADEIEALLDGILSGASEMA